MQGGKHWLLNVSRLFLCIYGAIKPTFYKANYFVLTDKLTETALPCGICCKHHRFAQWRTGRVWTSRCRVGHCLNWRRLRRLEYNCTPKRGSVQLQCTSDAHGSQELWKLHMGMAYKRPSINKLDILGAWRAGWATHRVYASKGKAGRSRVVFWPRLWWHKCQLCPLWCLIILSDFVSDYIET